MRTQIVEFGWRYALATFLPCVFYSFGMVWLLKAHPADFRESVCGPPGANCYVLPGQLIGLTFGPLIAYPMLWICSVAGAALVHRAMIEFRGSRLVVWLLVWLAAGISSMMPMLGISVLFLGVGIFLIIGNAISHQNFAFPFSEYLFFSFVVCCIGAMYGLICGVFYELSVQIEKLFTQQRAFQNAQN
jgi:hypothetical protein